MRFDKVISLVSFTYTKDSLAQEIETPVSREVFANEFSVSAGQFWEAGRAGLKPEREYQMRACDYADETHLEVDGVGYTIIRVERRGEWVRLTCQRLGADMVS